MTEKFIDRRPTLPEEHEPEDMNTVEDSDAYNEYLDTLLEYILELFNSDSEKSD